MEQKNQNKWLVIVNPNAGNCKGERDWETIKHSLKHEGIDFESSFTKGKEHATELASDGITAGYRKLIIVGGDGTLNEVVNGVFRNKACRSDEVTLGVIPVGTGNDWCKMFGIPHDYTGAIRIIRENKTMLHDAGTIIYSEGTERRERYFINIAGIGFESAVVQRTNHQKERGHGGKLIYLYNLVVTLFSYRNKKVKLKIDEERRSARIFSINIGNGRFCGGGMRQTPHALPDDGLLDITVINGMGKFEIVRNLNILYNGKILDHPSIDGYRCKTFEVYSDNPIYTEADGESLGHTPATFGIVPLSLKVIYGTRLIQ